MRYNEASKEQSMNIFIKFALPAVASAAMVTHQDAVTLRRDLKEGQVDNYAMSMSGKELITSPLGLGDREITTTSSMKLSLAVGKVDEAAHKAALTMTASEIKFVMQAPMIGAMPKQEIPKQIVSRGFLDDHNRIVEMKLPAGPAGQPGAFGATDFNGFLFIEYPDAPVKQGDKWTVTFPKTPMLGDQEIKMPATLVGPAKWGDQDAWELKSEAAVPLNIDLNKLMKGQKDPTGGMLGTMHMILTGSIDIAVDVLVEKSSGRALKMTMKTKGKQKIDIADRGMSIPMTNDATMTMELQK